MIVTPVLYNTLAKYTRISKFLLITKCSKSFFDFRQRQTKEVKHDVIKCKRHHEKRIDKSFQLC